MGAKICLFPMVEEQAECVRKKGVKEDIWA
jgi:hypothetical protein